MRCLGGPFKESESFNTATNEGSFIEISSCYYLCCTCKDVLKIDAKSKEARRVGKLPINLSPVIIKEEIKKNIDIVVEEHEPTDKELKVFEDTFMKKIEPIQEKQIFLPIRKKDPELLVYLLECSDNSYFCGITNDINKSMKEHSNGDIIYTKKKLPVNLCYFEKCNNQESAELRKKLISKKTKEYKLKMISEFKLKN